MNAIANAIECWDYSNARDKGDWRRTPLLLRAVGLPEFRRPIYADIRIGGGVDGWEYSDRGEV
jgi:hypothetical protein